MLTSASPHSADSKLTLRGIVQDLFADGLISSDDKAILSSPAFSRPQQGKHPLVIISERGLYNHQRSHEILSLEALTRWLAERSGLSYYPIDPLKTDVAAVTQVMTYAYAARFNILAVEVHADEILIATAEPQVTEWVSELSQVLNTRITPVFSNPEDIKRYSLEFYSLARSVFGASRERADETLSGLQNLEQLMELGRAGKLDANDQHVVSIVDWLLQYAFDQRASDIHLEPRREQGNVRFRIDGVLHVVYQIPTAVMSAVTSRIKILGRMDVAEKRRPQDGRLKTRTPDNTEVELRLSTMPTAFGEKLVMRIFDPEVLVKDFQSLGFAGKEAEIWQQWVSESHGIILVTGPTGSGKTTTLYSTLKALAKPEINVCSIEDPIEMVEPSFNQMQVQHNIGLDFASGVRTLLRQDPDVIMVGEIRDLETAEMAIQAALTGHLIFSTLHTNDSTSAVARLLEIGMPPYLIKATILGVLAQRLVRTLCPHCKRSDNVDEGLWQSVTKPWSVSPPERIQKPGGCLECRQTGYRGRIGIFEMLPVTSQLHSLIHGQCDLNHLRREAIKHGLRPLRLNGAQKVVEGVTTIEEVIRVAPPVLGH